MPCVIALTLDAAKNIAVVVALVFAVGSVLAFVVLRTIVQKLATALVLALLAFSVWTQRAALQDCADKVRDSYAREGTSVTFLDTDCSFFGVTVTISDPRDDPSDTGG